MSKFIVLIGLPGSGKSTWAKEYIINNPHTKRVNRDTLREMVDFTGPYSKKNEAANRSLRDVCIDHLLLLGHDVISDDTNVYPDKREEMITYVKRVHPHVDLEIVQITTPIEECIRRDAGRPKPVGEKVIRGMAKSSGFMYEGK